MYCWHLHCVCLLGLLLYFREFFRSSQFSPHTNTESFWGGRYKKAAIVVLDGARADTMFREGQHATMPKMLSIPKTDACWALSLCDLPTSTSVRIYSIFSGMPTGVCQTQDSLLPFECKVDNLVRQALRCNMTVSFAGDETWINLFPDLQKGRYKTYCAFSKKTFAEEQEIIDEALAAVWKHDIAITHLVGYDLLGHIVGIRHPRMRDFLALYDRFIFDLYSTMDRDCVLILLSDHGTEEDGDHGGASLKQRASFFGAIAKDLYPRDPAPSSEQAGILSTLGIHKRVGVISQNDILPTLCHLIGVPVPENSSGTYIRELIDPAEHRDAYMALVYRKLRLLKLMTGKSFSVATDSDDDLLQADALLTREIFGAFKKMTFAWPFAGLTCLALGILLLLWKHLHSISVASLVAVFLIFMTAHSVHSIIQEDLISAVGAAIALSPLSSLLLLFFLLFAGKFPPFESSRAFPFSVIPKLPSFFECSCLCTLLGALFVVVYAMTLFGAPSFAAPFLPLLLALVKFFRPSRNVPWPIALLTLGRRSFSLLAYSPLSFIFAEFFLPRAVASAFLPKDPACRAAGLFFLLKAAFFVTGHNHALGSLNWKVAFIFSDRQLFLVSAASVLLDVVYPYLVFFMHTDLPTLELVSLLQAVETLCACAVNFWFLGDGGLFGIFFMRSIFFAFFLCLLMALQAAWAFSESKAAGRGRALIARACRSAPFGRWAWRRRGEKIRPSCASLPCGQGHGDTGEGLMGVGDPLLQGQVVRAEGGLGQREARIALEATIRGDKGISESNGLGPCGTHSAMEVV